MHWGSLSLYIAPEINVLYSRKKCTVNHQKDWGNCQFVLILLGQKLSNKSLLKRAPKPKYHPNPVAGMLAGSYRKILDLGMSNILHLTAFDRS